MTVVSPPQPLTRHPVGDVPPPPFALPGEHFVAALVWFALGGAGLVLIAPQLAEGGALAPEVIAVTHCFTLGWITTSIFGVMYQFMPVAVSVRARCYWLAHATFVLLQAGIVAMVAGSWTSSPPVMAAGWALLVLAALGITSNFAFRLWKAPKGKTTARYVIGALCMLLAALGVAGFRLANALGWVRLDRLGVLTAHVHVAAIGFATLMVVGVGARMLPMFLLSHDHANRPLGWIGPAAGAGLVLLTIGALARVTVLEQIGGVAVAAAILLYLFLASDYFRRRTRRVLDPGLWHIATAHGFLAAASVLGIVAVIAPVASFRRAAAYGITGLLGWLAILIAGFYYKIVPFLTWMRRFGDRVGAPDTPKVADLMMPRVALIGLGCLAAGAATLALGAGLGIGLLAYAGAGSFAVGTTLTVAQYLRLAVGR